MALGTGIPGWGRRSDRRFAAAAAGVLHGEVKRRGAGFVLQRRIGACLEKAFHSGGAPCADGAVQRKGAVFVLSVDGCL